MKNDLRLYLKIERARPDISQPFLYRRRAHRRSAGFERVSAFEESELIGVGPTRLLAWRETRTDLFLESNFQIRGRKTRGNQFSSTDKQ